MLASKITKDVHLITDPKVRVTVCKLGWSKLKTARKVMVNDTARTLLEMGEENVARVIREHAAATAAQAEQVDAVPTANSPSVVLPEPEMDLLAVYDPLEVLVGGVKSWSVSAPINRDTLGDLDMADAEFLAREVLALTGPPTGTPEQEKNDSSASIAS